MRDLSIDEFRDAIQDPDDRDRIGLPDMPDSVIDRVLVSWPDLEYMHSSWRESILPRIQRQEAEAIAAANAPVVHESTSKFNFTPLVVVAIVIFVLLSLSKLSDGPSYPDGCVSVSDPRGGGVEC